MAGVDSTARSHHPRRRTRPAVAAVAVAVTAALAGCATAATPASPGGSHIAAPARADVPRSAGIDPELQRRFDVAQAAAAAQGFQLAITSGRRTAKEQEQLVKEVAEHGSVEEAHKWVLPRARSAHVAGTAIDVGDQRAAQWLTDHQRKYGLCRTYANEWWHFELVGKVGQACPRMHANSASGWKGVDAG